MKNRLKECFCLVAIVIASVWAGYATGHHRGYKLGIMTARRNSLVGSIDALHKIRKGDIPETTRQIERLCFAQATSVYTFFPKSDFIAKTFLGDIRQYRQTYRTNQADWSPMEQQLEKQLAKWN